MAGYKDGVWSTSYAASWGLDNESASDLPLRLVDAIFSAALAKVTLQQVTWKNNESVAFGAAVHGSHFDPFLSLLTCESPKDDIPPVTEKHSEQVSEEGEEGYVIVTLPVSK